MRNSTCSRKPIQFIDNHILKSFVGTVDYHLLERWPIIIPSGQGSVDISVNDGISFLFRKLVDNSNLAVYGLIVLPFGEIAGIDNGIFIT